MALYYAKIILIEPTLEYKLHTLANEIGIPWCARLLENEKLMKSSHMSKYHSSYFYNALPSSAHSNEPPRPLENSG